jgi:hypothetical protein
MKNYLLALSCKTTILLIVSLIFGIACEYYFGKGGILIFILGFITSTTPFIIDNENVKYLLRYRCVEYDKEVEKLNSIISSIPDRLKISFEEGAKSAKKELSSSFSELSTRILKANIHGLEVKFCPQCSIFHVSDIDVGNPISYCDKCRGL